MEEWKEMVPAILMQWYSGMAGESKNISFDIPIAYISYYDEGVKEFVVEPMAYEVFVGRHSLDERSLRVRFRVELN